MIFSPAEDGYLLHDEKNERKYNFKLADALDRARTVGWKLFDKKVFYATSKIPVDVKILKNVVTAGGGQVRPKAALLFLFLTPRLGGNDSPNSPDIKRQRKPTCCFLS